MTGYRNPPQTAPSSTGVTTSGLPCIGRPAAITPITLEGENNVLFVRCEALRDLARDGSLGLPQASIDVVTDVLSDLREYGAMSLRSCSLPETPIPCTTLSSTTHAAPIKSGNLIRTRAYFSNHPAQSSTSPSPLLPASSTDPSLSRKRRLDDVDEAESAPLPKRPELTGDDMAVNTPSADLARPPAVSTTAEVRERLVSSSLQLQPTSGEKRARVDDDDDDDDDDEGQSVKWTSAAMLRGRAIQLGEAAKLYEQSAMMVDEANELCKQADQKLEGLCGH